MDWLTLAFIQVVLAVFAIGGSSFLFPDKFGFPRLRNPPPIRNPENLRKDLASQTFRLKGIPATYKGRETTKGDVKELVRKDFAVEESIEIYVESLGRNPTSRSQKIATLSFSKTPLRLATSPKSARAFQGTSKSDLRLDIDFHGLTPLHSHDDAECDLEVVALSGLNGHAFGSFKQRGGDFMWLRDDLARSLPGARIYIYGYASEMQGSDSFQTLADLGLTFQEELEALLDPRDENKAPNPVVLVGHSLGGLILKQALCEMANSKRIEGKAILKSLQAVLFFGTPNQGMDITSLIPMVEGQPNELFLRSLDSDTSELRLQAQHWEQIFVLREGDMLSASFQIISFYETKESPTAIKVDGKWKMAGPPRKLVDRSSATHGRPWNREEQFVKAINRNHSDLVKFEASTDPIYQERVLPLFTRFYETAKKRQ
ncbi:hypothetical protein BFW01_g486 [Lasiodiplodia theobromae]|nr:hypothetical protein BFW01_g486 [Lasiodiplodia theobromae]